MFERAYEEWIAGHVAASKGERRRRLESKREEKRLFLQRVLWPVLGTLAPLHPEYEVADALGRTRYLDVAYVAYPLLIDFEQDGCAPHQWHISREEVAEERRRDLGLMTAGWQVVRFSADDIRHRPAECREMLRRYMQRWKPVRGFDSRAADIIRLALSQNAVVRLRDVEALHGVSANTARKMMRELVDRGIFRPASPRRRRVHAYRLNREIRGV